MFCLAYVGNSIPDPSFLFSNSLDRSDDNRRHDGKQNILDHMLLGLLGFRTMLEECRVGL